ncbi:MAG: hypothetical protein JWN94_1325 [Betaproteobacteria bacterium]|nr:hypothetical protein [Betaproteobacteria bacterium]
MGLCLTLTAPCFAAEIAKWVDKDGKVQYGDPINAPAASNELQRKSGTAPPKTKSLDDQTWNRAVDRAENTATGSAGRNIGKFAAPEPRQAPPVSGSSYSQTYSRAYNSRTPGDAIRENEAERRFAAQQEARQQAVENHRNQIIANCERQRNTNCRDDSTIRHMDNLEKPGGYRRH